MNPYKMPEDTKEAIAAKIAALIGLVEKYKNSTIYQLPLQEIVELCQKMQTAPAAADLLSVPFESPHKLVAVRPEL
jgi:hypothetical protein